MHNNVEDIVQLCFQWHQLRIWRVHKLSIAGYMRTHGQRIRPEKHTDHEALAFNYFNKMCRYNCQALNPVVHTPHTTLNSTHSILLLMTPGPRMIQDDQRWFMDVSLWLHDNPGWPQDDPSMTKAKSGWPRMTFLWNFRTFYGILELSMNFETFLWRSSS